MDDPKLATAIATVERVFSETSHVTDDERAALNIVCNRALTAGGTEVTEQRMVPEVTSDAVRGTAFFRWLNDVSHDSHIEDRRWDELAGLGLAQYGPPDITAEGRTILAALQAGEPQAGPTDTDVDALKAEYLVHYGRLSNVRQGKLLFPQDDPYIELRLAVAAHAAAGQMAIAAGISEDTLAAWAREYKQAD